MQTLKKFNFMIREDIRKDLERLVPRGEKSRVVNDALRKELDRLKRKKLTEKLLSIREKGPAFSTEEILEELGRERKRGTKE